MVQLNDACPLEAWPIFSVATDFVSFREGVTPSGLLQQKCNEERECHGRFV